MGKRKVLYMCVLGALSMPVSAANIVVVGGAGFSDGSAPKAGQKGNNPGNTLGELRTNVFNEAAAVWGAILNSNVTITVNASFAVQGCSGSGAQLGNAGPTSTLHGFAGSEADITYPVALAESITGNNMNGAAAEISAEFNSVVDTDPTCLGGGGWYYGLDTNAPDDTTPLFSTVLHEMGHGLGFVSYVTDTGAWLNGRMDPFSQDLRDLGAGKNWGDMSNAERQSSQLNEPDLVWNGPQVTADRAMHLDPAAEMRINAPSPAGDFDVEVGQQSAAIPGGGLTMPVVDGNTLMDASNNPADGCTQLGFSSTQLSGQIVLFDATNNCPAVLQVVYSEFAGAEGVIIADITGTGFPDVSGLIGNDIFIPYVGIQQSEANQLRGNIAAANVTLQLSTTKLLGENQGKVKMYAPGVIEPGSSVSHWSSSASPDLLMEAAQGELTYDNVDLTAAAFKDIGWSVNIPGGVVEIIYEDGFE